MYIQHTLDQGVDPLVHPRSGPGHGSAETAPIPRPPTDRTLLVPSGASMAVAVRRADRALGWLVAIGLAVLIAGIATFVANRGGRVDGVAPGASAATPAGADAGALPGATPDVGPDVPPVTVPVTVAADVSEGIVEQPVPVDEPAPNEPSEPAPPLDDPDGTTDDWDVCPETLAAGRHVGVQTYLMHPLHAEVHVVNCVDEPIDLELSGENGITFSADALTLEPGETAFDVVVDEAAWDGEMKIKLYEVDCCAQYLNLIGLGPVPELDEQI